MKIIDSNGKKDYYDYLVSINGIDEGIVFDRRGSIVLETGIHGNSFFSKTVLYNDTVKQLKRVYDYEKHKASKIMQGLVLHFVLEVGTTHYLFKVERYIEDDKLMLDTDLLEKRTECKKLNPKHIINIIPIQYEYGYFRKSHTVRHLMSQIIENPILRDSQIPAFISPEEIYSEIYNYISSTKDKPIVDNRNDVQKLESQGFDKKTSFRKM